MQTGEIQRHGDTYYRYRPDLGLYSKRKEKWKAMYLWAVEQFGDPSLCDTIPPRRWYANDLQFNFLHEEDRMYMILRWE